jgi:hypothetical protein
LRSTTFVVELVWSTRAPIKRAYSHDRSTAEVTALDTAHAQEHEAENIMLKRERPVAIRPLGVAGKVPVTCERMAAIRNPETMAGSPDADRRFDQRPAVLRMVFVFGGSPSFANP